MRKGSKFRLFLLFIAGAIFVAFVFIMQRQFNNPDFDYQNEVAGINQLKQDEENNDTDVTAEEMTDMEEETDEESDESVIEEERQISADLLNIRTGPGPDYDVAETLILGDVVQVIDDGSEWVEISYQGNTGYANSEYLEPISEE